MKQCLYVRVATDSLNAVSPPRYSYIHLPYPTDQGGVVAVVYYNNICNLLIFISNFVVSSDKAAILVLGEHAAGKLTLDGLCVSLAKELGEIMFQG